MKKKIITLITALALVTSVSGKAFAAGETTLTNVAGITPDSILYPVDKALDDIKVALSSGDSDKAKALADVAQERLGEAEAMIEKGKNDLAQQALDAYNTSMQQADDKLQNAADSTSGVTTAATPSATTTTTDSAVSTTTDSAVNTGDTKTDAKLESAETEVTNKQDQAIDVLKALEDRLTGDIKDIVSKVLDVQEVKHELVVNFVKERHEFNDAKKDYNMAKVDLKKVEKSGDQDAIKKAQDELKQKEQTYTDSKKELVEAFKNKKEADKAIESIIEKVKEEIKAQANSNPTIPTTTTTTTNPTTPAPTTDTASAPAATTPAASTTTTVPTTVQQQVKHDDEDDDKDEKSDSKENKGKEKAKEIKEKINELKEKHKGNNGNRK